MNRGFFLNSTRLIIVHIKEHNYKLCRKGLLERCLKMKIFLGEFKCQDNNLIKESLSMNSKNQNAMKSVNEEKENLMKKEIGKLISSLKSLDRTIESIRQDVKSRISDENYQVWLRRINSISSRFKAMYSETCNDYYDHCCKMSKKASSHWNNIQYDMNWIKTNLCNMYIVVDNDDDISKCVDGFEEGDLNVLFDEKPTSEIQREDSSQKRKHGEISDENTKNTKNKKNSMIMGDLEPISEEEENGQEEEEEDDENSIINDILAIVDEVGEVDMTDFEDMWRQMEG